ncbi:hypothetical protein H0G86_011388 [Trichoderma simmonsii]|uniref:Uncharacterized protein n=1 Tax=Trichoderma simmonsii TaxID=1491479 RepID=A0A8G0LLG0_9HYPO|nr:hypothetical protein H0G86_011388 [Trichoderma simmonsii]
MSPNPALCLFFSAPKSGVAASFVAFPRFRFGLGLGLGPVTQTPSFLRGRHLQASSLKITQNKHQPSTRISPNCIPSSPLLIYLSAHNRPAAHTHSLASNRRRPINPKRPPSGISIVRGEAPLLQRASSWLLGALLSLPLQPRQINTVSNRPLSLPSITAACLVSSATQTALCSLLPALSQKTLPLLISNQDIRT